MKRSVGILVFDDAEVLDFAGPFEVFAVASELNDHELFDVFTIGIHKDPIKAVNGLTVIPTYSIQDIEKLDILIISGGAGTRSVMENEDVLDWIDGINNSSELTISICSGSRLLGKIGLLDHQPYCTHHEVYTHMSQIAPTGQPQKDHRFVQAGKIYTSGGISAGLDLSLHIVQKLHGKQIMEQTAEYMEYEVKS